MRRQPVSTRRGPAFRFLDRPCFHVVFVALALPAVHAATTHAEPPRVVGAVPDNGDTDVDPGIKLIRIKFDQDMIPDGFSVCGGGPNFPEVTDQPYFASKRVFLIPVRLKPNHDYSFSINCPSAQNFRSVGGESALIYPVTFRTAGAKKGDPSKKLTSKVNAESVTRLRELIDGSYAYRDQSGADWKSLFKEFGPKLKKAGTQAQFARTAAKLLGHAKDVHIWLQVEKVTFPTHQRKFMPNVKPDFLPRVVPNWKKHNDTVSTGRFDEGIGYISISNWSTSRRGDLDAAYAALSEFMDGPGLIIDVRENSGGDEALAREFAGCFVSSPTVYSKNVYRTKRAKSGWGKPQERTVEPNKARPAYRGKVAVLIGQRCMSSCESFILMMRHGAGATLVGDRTYGSSGNPKPHELPNGVMVALPSWKDMQPDGTPLEGKGITPDVRVKPKKGDFTDTDPVLDAALARLRQ